MGLIHNDCNQVALIHLVPQHFPPHRTGKERLQNARMPSISSCFTLGLTSRRIYSLRSCHRFLIGLRSGDSVHSFRGHPGLGIVGRMLRVIALHKVMVVRVGVVNKGEKEVILKDVHIELLIHYPLEHTDPSPPSPADPGPHVNFSVVFRSLIEQNVIMVTCVYVLLYMYTAAAASLG